MKPIYYAIETSSREFDARVLFSLIASNKGRATVIGHKKDLACYLESVNAPPGFYIHKSASKKQMRKFAEMKFLGHMVLVNDEEGLVYPSCELYIKNRLSKESLQYVDAFFCWGEKHAKDVSSLLEVGSKIIKVTGNPRFDVYRQPYLTAIAAAENRLAEKRVLKILVNTNLAAFNPHEDIRLDGLSESVKARYGYDKEVAGYFVEMINSVANRFPEAAIVVRPHPSEALEYWVSKIKGLSNVIVRREGTAIAESYCADIVIHNGCTTGIEAKFIGKEVISYSPMPPSSWDKHLPSKVSRTIKSLHELLDVIEKINVNGMEADCEALDEIKYHIQNVDGELAAERMLDCISALKATSVKKPFLDQVARLLVRIKSDARMRIQSKAPRRRSKYSLSKCPEISCTGISEKLERFCEVRPDLEKPIVEEVWPGCFEVSIKK